MKDIEQAKQFCEKYQSAAKHLIKGVSDPLLHRMMQEYAEEYASRLPPIEPMSFENFKKLHLSDSKEILQARYEGYLTFFQSSPQGKDAKELEDETKFAKWWSIITDRQFDKNNPENMRVKIAFIAGLNTK